MTEEPVSAPPLPAPGGRSSRQGMGRVFRGALAVLAVVALAMLFWQLRPVLLLLFAATLVAILLDALAGSIRRRTGLPRPLALTLATITGFGSVGAIIWLFGAELAAQINQLAALIPSGWDALTERFGEDRMNAALERMTPSTGNIFSIVQSILAFVSGMLTATMLAMLGGVFLAVHPKTYRNGFLLLLPPRWESRADDLIYTLGTALRRFMAGQVVSMLFVGITIFAGLQALGAPSSLALAVIAAVLGFIPVIGPLLAAAPGVLVGLTMGGDAIWQVILLYFVVQQIDGNLVNAIVMRHSVKIPPALTMFALFAIGSVFGPAALILGGPITVLAFVLVRKLWIEGHLGKRLPD